MYQLIFKICDKYKHVVYIFIMSKIFSQNNSKMRCLDVIDFKLYSHAKFKLPHAFLTYFRL